jgi:hypothetical protein
MEENKIKHVYGETIFDRGKGYFKEGRVLNVVKFRNKLFGEVIGTERYNTEVKLDDLQCNCSCPYRHNCKHGVAVLLHYFSGEYTEGDEAMESIESASKEDLKEIIERLVRVNPHELLPYLLPLREKGGANEKLVKGLDKQIKTMLKSIEHYYADVEFVRDFARLIKTNEDILTKDQIFYIVKFLVEKCEDYGYFYDDYTDATMGDEIFENLCDAFVRKPLEESDFERLVELNRADDYDMLVPFFDRMVDEENAKRLCAFDSFIEKFISEYSFIEFLISSGKTEKAGELIERKTSLGEQNRFDLYLKIDRDGAVEFAKRKGFYSSLIRYYHEIGEHENAVGLFEEAIATKTNRERLSKDSYLYKDVFDSIKKFKGLEASRGKRILSELFAICYSLKHYDLCVDVGMRLSDKELLSRLIKKKRDYKFSVESRLKLLDYLKDEMREEVEKELKEFTESLIEEKGDYAYEKAVECSFVLRKIQDDAAWREYLKGLYERHSRKINLWREFKWKGVTVKRVKGAVRLELRS